MVIHHTDCGMLTFKNEDVWGKVEAETGPNARDIDFLPFSDSRAALGRTCGRSARVRSSQGCRGHRVGLRRANGPAAPGRRRVAVPHLVRVRARPDGAAMGLRGRSSPCADTARSGTRRAPAHRTVPAVPRVRVPRGTGPGALGVARRRPRLGTAGEGERVLVLICGERVHRVSAVTMEVVSLRRRDEEREESALGDQGAHRVQTGRSIGADRG